MDNAKTNKSKLENFLIALLVGCTAITVPSAKALSSIKLQFEGSSSHYAAVIDENGVDEPTTYNVYNLNYFQENNNYKKTKSISSNSGFDEKIIFKIVHVFGNNVRETEQLTLDYPAWKAFQNKNGFPECDTGLILIYDDHVEISCEGG